MIYKIKAEIEKKFREFRESSFYETNNSELASLRFNISSLIFGNDGILDIIHGWVEELEKELKEEILKTYGFDDSKWEDSKMKKVLEKVFHRGEDE